MERKSFYGCVLSFQRQTLCLLNHLMVHDSKDSNDRYRGIALASYSDSVCTWSVRLWLWLSDDVLLNAPKSFFTRCCAFFFFLSSFYCVIFFSFSFLSLSSISPLLLPFTQVCAWESVPTSTSKWKVCCFKRDSERERARVSEWVSERMSVWCFYLHYFIGYLSDWKSNQFDHKIACIAFFWLCQKESKKKRQRQTAKKNRHDLTIEIFNKIYKNKYQKKKVH